VTLSHGTFNGFSHGMCVHASRGSIMCVWVGPKPEVSSRRTRHDEARLVSPRLT